MINEDALRSIEKLHEMKAVGILSEEIVLIASQHHYRSHLPYPVHFLIGGQCDN